MVGNKYEYYQEIVPVEKWVHSAVKNITLDNEPLEINYMEYMDVTKYENESTRCQAKRWN